MNLEDALNGLVQSIIRVFPASPFAPFIEQFAELPYLGYLNWFFPVRNCLIIMAAWLSAISLFYLYSVIARWVKLIGD